MEETHAKKKTNLKARSVIHKIVRLIVNGDPMVNGRTAQKVVEGEKRRDQDRKKRQQKMVGKNV